MSGVYYEANDKHAQAPIMQLNTCYTYMLQHGPIKG